MTTGMLRVRGWFFSRSVAVVPRHVWHGEVHDDHVWSRCHRHLDGLRAIGGHQNAEATMAQVLGVHLARMRGVVDDEDESYAPRTRGTARTIPEQGQGWRTLEGKAMHARLRPK